MSRRGEQSESNVSCSRQIRAEAIRDKEVRRGDIQRKCRGKGLFMKFANGINGRLSKYRINKWKTEGVEKRGEQTSRPAG
jgi:hypothetical protein